MIMIHDFVQDIELEATQEDINKLLYQTKAFHFLKTEISKLAEEAEDLANGKSRIDTTPPVDMWTALEDIKEIFTRFAKYK